MKKKRNIKRRRLQLQGTDGNIKNLYLPQGTTEAKRNDFKLRAIRFVNAQINDFELSPQDQKWLKQQSNEIKEKLRVLGVGVAIEKKSDVDKYKIVNVVRTFFDKKKFEGSTNEDKYIRAATRLEKYCRQIEVNDIRDFTSEDAIGFAKWLVEEEKLQKNSSARRTNGYVNSIFKFAYENLKVTEENVFRSKEIPKQVLSNEEKHYYIDKETTKKIFDQIDHEGDRLRFVLMRYLGLRSPSEMNELRWSDFNWKDGLVTVRSPKLINHERKYRRQCAFKWPEAIKVISAAYDKRTDDNELILPPISHKNLTKHVKSWLGRANVALWPSLIQNFRRTAITDACEIFPSHVVAAYFGHSEVISMTHYRMVHADYAKRLGA